MALPQLCRVRFPASWLAVEVVLNRPSDAGFFKFAEAIADGSGFYNNDVGCVIAGSGDEGAPAEGVHCYCYVAEQQVGNDEFLDCFLIAVESYLLDHPDDRPRFEPVIYRARRRYMSPL